MTKPLAPLLGTLEEAVFRRPSWERTFNPWRDFDPGLDVDEAPRLRRENLTAYLDSYEERPEVLLLGEAPSWRGCRFSGVPFTAEAHLLDDALPVRGKPTSRSGRPLSEASGTILWRVLTPHFPRFLLWNVFPFHPHRAGAPRSNRRPKWSEVQEFLALLEEITDELDPETVVAVGRTAERSLEAVGMPCRYVRHPAQGGAKVFEEAMREIFE